MTTEAAFDRQAGGYDAVADSVLNRALRFRVHEAAAPLIGPGTRVLDLGCGTGIDARWAVDQGADVTAIDASPAMIELAAARVPEASFAVADLNGEWADAVAGDHEVVLCDFGVVNCVADHRRFGLLLERVTLPDAAVVAVPMGRRVPWEQIPALVKGDLRTARRRRRGSRDAGAEYGDLQISFLSGREFSRRLGPDWRIDRVEALGWALPTHERRGLVERWPRFGRVLAAVDRSAATTAGRLGLGDHQLVVLRRSPTVVATS